MNRLCPNRRFQSAALLLALAAALLATPSVRAQHRMENRFLFVVDTSSAMKSRTNGIENAVMGLLDSNMKGEFRKNDTIGLWTYNENLNTEFPMEIWSDKRKDYIESEVRKHLRELHYEKRSHLEKVLPSLKQALAKSERLTIIFVYDGTDLIKGTSFDKDINELQKQYAREFRSSHVPMVTVLASRDGQFFDYTINYPSTVVIPHTADPLPPPETNAPPVLAAAPPVAAPAPAPPPTEPKPEHHIAIIMSGTNLLQDGSTPLPSPGSAAPTPTSASASAQPTPAPVSQPAPVTPLVVQPQLASPPAVVPTPTIVPPAAAVPAAPAPLVAQPAPVNTTPSEPPNTPPAETPTSAPAPVPAPAPALAKPVAVAAAPVPAPSSVPAAVVATQAASVPPAVSASEQVAMFIMAFSLLTIAVVLVLFLVRRSRSHAQPSLISQSMDRPR